MPGVYLVQKRLASFLLVLKVIAWFCYEFSPISLIVYEKSQVIIWQFAFPCFFFFLYCFSQHKVSPSEVQSVLVHLPRILSRLLWPEKWYSCLESIQIIMILQLMFVRQAYKKTGYKILKGTEFFSYTFKITEQKPTKCLNQYDQNHTMLYYNKMIK